MPEVSFMGRNASTKAVVTPGRARSVSRIILGRRTFLRTAGQLAATELVAARLVSSAGAQGSSVPGKIKIGQIGTAHAHASGKMAALKKLRDDYEIVAVVEPDPDRQRRAKDQGAYRGLAWMTEEQLLNTPGLRAVAVETEVAELVPTALRCAAAGMHVHLDKPAGTSLAAFQRLLDEAGRRGRTVQMGYMFRHNPAFRFCFQAVREGWLGEVFEVDGVISKTVNAQQRRELARYPGSMFELGCHLIDALVQVLGKPARVSSFSRRTRPEQDDLADNQLAVFEYAKATATIRSTLLEVEGQQRRQFVVCGEHGTVVIRPLEPPRLLLALDRPLPGYQKGYQEVPLPPLPGRYDDQLLELARIIRGEKEPEYPAGHDLAVQEAVLRASGAPLD
jgi:predicted dehydrogenase